MARASKSNAGPAGSMRNRTPSYHNNSGGGGVGTPYGIRGQGPSPYQQPQQRRPSIAPEQLASMNASASGTISRMPQQPQQPRLRTGGDYGMQKMMDEMKAIQSQPRQPQPGPARSPKKQGQSRPGPIRSMSNRRMR